MIAKNLMVNCYKNINQESSTLFKLQERQTCKKLYIAVSGGVDSMVLLYNTILLSKKNIIDFEVINIDHSIRKETSKRDSDFVEEFCNIFSIRFNSHKVDTIAYSKENKISIEMAARELRHAIYREYRMENSLILLGHNLDDNAETILMNISRGTGLIGLQGIDYENDFLLRPLIKTSRSKIEEFAKKHKIPYMNDETNQQNHYTRNFFRNEIIPKIKKAYTGVEKNLLMLSDQSKKIDEFIIKQTSKHITYEENRVIIKKGLFLLDEILINHTVAKVLNNFGDLKNYTKTNIEDIVALNKKQISSSLSLSSSYKAQKNQEGITIFKENKKDLSILNFVIGVIETKYAKIEINDREKGIGGELYCSKSELLNHKNIVIRTRRPKDYFRPFNGRKMSLASYLTKRKIPLYLRDKLYILASESEVLAVIGVEISDKIKIQNKMEETLYIRLKGK